MPWTPSDGPGRHTKKANTGAKKRQWSKTANSVRARAMEEGKSEDEADAQAIRVANAVVRDHPSHKRK